MTNVSVQSSSVAKQPSVRGVAHLLAPLDALAASSPSFFRQTGARFGIDGEHYELPRYLFPGPKGADAPIRIAIFAGIHGDEPEGVHAAIQFLKLLETKPEFAAGYAVSVYPIC